MISEFEAAAKEFLIKRVVYKTIFRGKGLEFDGYRRFNPDDDAGSIDWVASARSNDILVKQYIEERNLKIMFIIDVGDNMVFGSQEKLKCEYAAELSAALSHLIVTSGDKVGFIFFNDKVVEEFPPVSGANQFSLFSNHLTFAKNYGGDSKIESALDFVIDYVNNSVDCIIFVSDFLRINKTFFKKMNLISAKFEIIALMVKDPLDISLSDFGSEVIVEDPSSGEQIVVNPRIANKTYEKHALEQEKEVIELFNACDVDFLRLVTDKSFVNPLVCFLQERIEKKKYMVAK